MPSSGLQPHGLMRHATAGLRTLLELLLRQHMHSACIASKPLA
jgi:hypothetical protein